MWFKNITFFELEPGFTIEVEQLNDQLSAFAFSPCSAATAISTGWVSPHKNDEQTFAYHINGYSLIALKTQEKMVPASVVKEQLDEQVNEIEMRDNRKMRKKEKDSLKEAIYQDLLPRAFTKTNTLYAYIDHANGWLLVNTPSTRKAEDFTVHLRKAMGSLKIKLPDMSMIAPVLTGWVLGEAFPESFVIEDNCVIKDEDSTGMIKCQKQNLTAEDITALIDSGREVVQLSLLWRDQLAFSLSDEFILKSIKYLEVIQDQAQDVHTETEAEQLDAEFTIMTSVIADLLKELVAVFKNTTIKTSGNDESSALEQAPANDQLPEID